MDIYDATVMRVNATNDLAAIEKKFLSIAKAAYGSADEEKHYDVQCEIEAAFRAIQDISRELGQDLTNRWRVQSEEVHAIFDEIKAKYLSLVEEWTRELPHYNPYDRHDLLYFITSTINDIWLHDPNPGRPEAEAELFDLRNWAKRLEAIGATESKRSLFG